MAASPNYNQPVFASAPVMFARISTVAATTDFTTITSDSIWTVGTNNGGILERVTITFCTPIGETNTEQLVGVCLYDADNLSWVIRAIKAVPSVTVSHTVAPQSVEFTFTGGIVLPVDSQVGIFRTATAGGEDALNVVVEGGTFDIV